MFVTAYEVQLVYGGPEEGGWWYEAGDVLQVIECEEHEIEDAKASLKDTYADDYSGRPLSSVLSDGELRIVVDDQPGEPFPAERPHYE